MYKAIAAASVCLTLAACASGDAPRPGRWNPNATPRDEGWHSQTASLVRFDANHDGTLTKAELLAGLRAEFNAADTSGKNCLNPDQARAINEQRVQQDASQATPLVDWNQDNCIDFTEYSAAALSLFATLDKNEDGQLSPDELRAGRPGGGQGQSPGGPGGGHRGGRGHGGGRSQGQ